MLFMRGSCPYGQATQTLFSVTNVSQRQTFMYVCLLYCIRYFTCCDTKGSLLQAHRFLSPMCPARSPHIPFFALSLNKTHFKCSDPNIRDFMAQSQCTNEATQSDSIYTINDCNQSKAHFKLCSVELSTGGTTIQVT